VIASEFRVLSRTRSGVNCYDRASSLRDFGDETNEFVTVAHR